MVEPPRIFVSHSSKDNVWCETFVAALQRYSVHVWFDREGIGAGERWVPEIEQNIDRCDIFFSHINAGCMEFPMGETRTGASHQARKTHYWNKAKRSNRNWLYYYLSDA